LLCCKQLAYPADWDSSIL